MSNNEEDQLNNAHFKQAALALTHLYKQTISNQKKYDDGYTQAITDTIEFLNLPFTQETHLNTRQILHQFLVERRNQVTQPVSNTHTSLSHAPLANTTNTHVSQEDSKRLWSSDDCDLFEFKRTRL